MAMSEIWFDKKVRREQAAELRRFADSLAARMTQPDLGVDGDYAPTVASIVDELRARADHLDTTRQQ